MNYLYLIIVFTFSCLTAAEFTICSYNCGGLSEHYDYLRACSMQQLMQERYTAEPENMSINEKIQKLALKILFSPDSEEKMVAQQEWDRKGYHNLLEYLTLPPTDTASPNTIWNQKADAIISSYKIRPVVIQNDEVNFMISEHLKDLTPGSVQLKETRDIMAKRIFSHHLKYDIICLQEADYLNASQFPSQYEILLSATSHSKNGIAWNKERFELVENVGNILDKAFAVKLQDKENGKTVLIASGHISGCNPYQIVNNDSAKGDAEIQALLTLFETHESTLKLIGMDSNVTSLHPRLSLLKNAGYHLDYENFLDPTCSNPYQVLNTRIDWIFLKSSSSASIVNIPVLSVGLNNLQTNISDHKPIAAKIIY